MPRVFYSLLVSEKQSSCVPLPLGICAFLWWPVGSAPGSALCPPACWRTSGIQEARRQRKMTQTAAVFLKWSRTVVLLMYCQVEWERDGLSGICSDHEQDRFGAFLIGRVSTFSSFSSVIWLFHRCAMGADVPCSAAGHSVSSPCAPWPAGFMQPSHQGHSSSSSPHCCQSISPLGFCEVVAMFI